MSTVVFISEIDHLISMRFPILIWNGALSSASPSPYVIHILGRSPCHSRNVAFWSVDFLASFTSSSVTFFHQPYDSIIIILNLVKLVKLIHVPWVSGLFFLLNLYVWQICVSGRTFFLFVWSHISFFWFIHFLRSDTVFHVLCIQSISLSEGPFFVHLFGIEDKIIITFFLRANILTNNFSQILWDGTSPIFSFFINFFATEIEKVLCVSRKCAPESRCHAFYLFSDLRSYNAFFPIFFEIGHLNFLSLPFFVIFFQNRTRFYAFPGRCASAYHLFTRQFPPDLRSDNEVRPQKKWKK